MTGRSLGGLVIAFVGLAVGLPACGAVSTGHGAPRLVFSASRVGELRFSVPRGFNEYAVLAPMAPAVAGHVLTDFSVTDPVKFEDVWGRWTPTYVSGPPLNRVALELFIPRLGLPPGAHRWLRMPLTFNEPGWQDEKLTDGSLGYRFGWFRFHHVGYQVLYWSGPDAPANDRAAVLRALKSIRPAR